MARTTLAFNSERLRQLLWQRVAPPPEMLQKALTKLDAQLEATETKFFTNQGMLVSQVDVPAHAIQQSAAVAIAKIADAMPRDRAEKAGPPSVTLEIKDGVFRLHIGAVGSSGEEDAYRNETHLNDDGLGLAQLAPEVSQLLDIPPPVRDTTDVEEPPVQVVRMRDFKDRREALRILLGEADGPAS